MHYVRAPPRPNSPTSFATEWLLNGPPGVPKLGTRI